MASCNGQLLSVFSCNDLAECLRTLVTKAVAFGVCLCVSFVAVPL